MSPPNGHVNGAVENRDKLEHPAPSLHAPGVSAVSLYTPAQIKEFVSLLEVPFDTSVIEWRVTNTSRKGPIRGQVIPYADQRAYTDRLNSLFSPAGWTRKYSVHTSANFQRAKDEKITAKVFVTCDLTIFGIGSHSATGEEWADDENAGTAAETLSFRHIGVVQEEYAVSPDGMKVFGVLDLETQMEGCRFSIGFRNSHDKSLRLGLTAGLRVFVCSNMAFSGDFTPVLAKHTKSFNLVDTLSVGVDRIQRNFEPLQRQVELWRKTQITDDTARLIFYSAFIDGKLEAPRSLLPEVHRLYFEPQYSEFAARTMWSLSNAFTSAFKKLDPVPQFKATAKLGEFLSQLPN